MFDVHPGTQAPRRHLLTHSGSFRSCAASTVTVSTPASSAIGLLRRFGCNQNDSRRGPRKVQSESEPFGEMSGAKLRESMIYDLRFT